MVHVRVIAVLLALLMAAGIAAPTVLASPDAACLVDDGAGGALGSDPAVAASSIVVMALPRCELRHVVAPVVGSHGRLHPISVFRPPRPIASR